MSKSPKLIQRYEDLVEAVRQERRRRGMSQLELDDRAGLHEGYTSKLEQPNQKYGRSFGVVSLPLVLQALGLALFVVRVDDPVKPAPKPLQGQEPLPLDGGGIRRKLLKEE